MKAKVLGLTVFGLVVILFVSLNDKIRSHPMILKYLDIVLNSTTSRTNFGAHTDSNTGTTRVTQSAGILHKEKLHYVKANFELMRRNFLHDPRALYLSRQVQPPFDPQYKNPCWWYDDDGNNNKSSLACLPYFFLAGFPKAGTTDLHARLIQHPFIAKARMKEPHYLTRNQFRGDKRACRFQTTTQDKVHTSCDVIQYAKNFFDVARAKIGALKSDTIDWSAFHGNTKSKKLFKYPGITMDASASTAWDNSNGFHIVRDIPLPQTVLQSNASIIDWIVGMNPNIRILVIMREPMSRVYSDYNYFRSSTSPEEFDNRVDMFLQNYRLCIESGASALTCAPANQPVRVHIGLYHLYIEEWLLRLPRERIHVIRTDDYHNNMTHSLRGIFDFLELPQPNAKEMETIVTSKEKNVNHNRVLPMLSTTRNKLMEFYKPFNRKLANLLGDDAYLWEDVYGKYERS